MLLNARLKYSALHRDPDVYKSVVSSFKTVSQRPTYKRAFAIRSKAVSIYRELRMDYLQF